MVANILSHLVGCLFILLMVSFVLQKVLFELIFALVDFALGVKSKKSLPRPMSRGFPPRSLMVSGLTFKSLNNFELGFCVW